jgi:hypothetical protein
MKSYRGEIKVNAEEIGEKLEIRNVGKKMKKS